MCQSSPCWDKHKPNRGFCSQVLPTLIHRVVFLCVFVSENSVSACCNISLISGGLRVRAASLKWCVVVH